MNSVDLEREIREIESLVDSVHGWLTPAEGRLLYRLARTRVTGRGAIVEIGSWKGKSTIYLGRGSLAGAGMPVYAIDPHTGSAEQRERYGAVNTFAEFQQNIRHGGVEKIVRPLVAASRQAAERFSDPIELLFIDGAHDYDSVRDDFDRWSAKIIEGGCIAFHDTRKPGPRRVVQESICPSRGYADIEWVDSIIVVRKVTANSAVDRWRNRSVFLRRSFTRSCRRLLRRAS